MMDYIALKSEIDLDPTSLGFASLLTQGSDAGIAKLLNHIGTERINKAIVTKEVFFVDFFSQMLGVFSSTELQASFAPLLLLLDQVGTIDYSFPGVQSALAGLASVPALGLTPDAITAIITRPCSRIETLFGAGCRITSDDVARAYGRI